VRELLDGLCAALQPGRRILIGREMTKLHEQFVLCSAEEWTRVRPSIPDLGEFSIVVEGASPSARDIDTDSARAALARLKAAGFSSRDAVRALSAALDIPANAAKKLDY
jgi:16S rRNA (cytidine1402-2'-O)-methyltransferase